MTDLITHEYDSMNDPAAPPQIGKARVDIALAALAGRQTAASRRQAQSDLRQIASAWGFGSPEAIPWGDVRAVHLEALKTRLMATRAPATCNRILSLARSCLHQLYLAGDLGDRAWEQVKAVKPVRGSRVARGRALEEIEIDQMLAAIALDDTPRGQRDAALASVAFRLGLRRSELVGLDLASYDQATRTLIVRGKGNKERALPMPGDVEAVLAAYVAVRGLAPGPLFVGATKGGKLTRRRLSDDAIYYLAKDWAARAGIQRWAPHDARRTFISEVLAIADLALAQQLAGHANPATTAKYDKRGAAAQRDVMDRLAARRRKA